MAQALAVYTRSDLPFSRLICWRTGAEYSHEGILLVPDEKQITLDSFVSHSALSCKGVRITTLRSFLKTATDFRITALDQEITDQQFSKQRELLVKYEGTPYDLKGAIGLGIGEDWQEDDAFWCTEWRAFNYLNMGLDLKYLNDVHRLSPKESLEWGQRTIVVNL
jgi:hypothetical protein